MASLEEREEKHAHNSYKAKFERLRSVKLTRQDQTIRLLDMSMLKVEKTLKPITTSFNLF
jgi:hypothetical protein